MLGVRRWRELVADRKKWKDAVLQAKAHMGCSANGRRRRRIIIVIIIIIIPAWLLTQFRGSKPSKCRVMQACLLYRSSCSFGFVLVEG